MSATSSHMPGIVKIYIYIGNNYLSLHYYYHVDRMSNYIVLDVKMFISIGIYLLS